MDSEDVMSVIGVVEENLPNTQFRVKLENGHEILCYLSGRMRKNYIKVAPGDTVEVQVTRYDTTRGRIYRRK